MSQQNQRGRQALVALVLAGLGAMLQVWQWVRGHAFWLDEQMIAMNLRNRGFSQLAGALDENQSAPLGWLAVERLLLITLGDGERALRLPALTFSIATLFLAWWAGRRWLSPLGTAVLVALFAANPMTLRYAGELKHYAVDVFFSALLLYLAARMLQEPQSWRRLAWLWGAAGVGLWFSMGAFLVMPAIGLLVVLAAWVHHDLRIAMRHALPGFAFLGLFGAHYVLALRPG